MTHDEVKKLILKEKLMVLYRGVPIEKMGQAAQALVRGGVKLLEITFDQTAANPIAEYKKAISTIRKAVGDDLVLGSGTVLTADQMQATYDAGGKFFVAPNTSEKIINKARELGLVAIPGAMTPSEVVAAWEYGADIVKLFPADDLGYHYIWNLRGPLKHIPLICTGGVNPDTIPEFLRYGVLAVGTGASILKKELLEANDFPAIEELARQHVNAVNSACKELGIG